MQSAHFYLNFPGTTRQAFELYEKAFGTKITEIFTYGESSSMDMGEIPDYAKDKIMHVTLPLTDKVSLMGSDVVQGFGPFIPFGRNFNVLVVANDKAEADLAFATLCPGGNVTMPLANAPWGPYFGMCDDKFGIPWMISLDVPV